MEKTRIIMTEVKGYAGRYVDFRIKDTGEHIAEVDRRGDKYVVLIATEGVFWDLVSEAWQKSRAINLAQKEIFKSIPDAEFKWNVTREIYKTI